MKGNAYNCLVVLGPTASGKTRLACRIADALNGEIISADSRQVYKHLDIGTGKDHAEYIINGKNIPHHLIDVCEPEQHFYLHDFIKQCEEAFNYIIASGKLPIICGGTGLYLDSLRKDFSLTQVKENEELRGELSALAEQELLSELKKFPAHLTSHADLTSKKRLIRAIEVAEYLQSHPGHLKPQTKPYLPFYVGIDVSPEERKKMISERLIQRIDHGLIEETESLLRKGITHDRLQFLGLEYKYTSLYLQNKISKTEFVEQLQTAIFQFSKRQMTWFRKMEKEGVEIHWIPKNEKWENILTLLKGKSFLP